MAIQLLDTGGTNKASIDAAGALRVRPSSPDLGSNGAYRVCQSSGLITTIAAGTASAGHLFAARWGHATKLAIITYFRASWVTVAGFTAAQEVGLELFQTRAYTVAHSGGTAITLTGDALKKRSSFGSTAFNDIRISTTTALTNGTHTIDPNPIASGGFAELAALATVFKGTFECTFAPNELGFHPLVLAQNQGLILRNQILMGAAGTARVRVEMDWLEVDSF